MVTENGTFGSKFTENFELLLHKINFFREKTGSIWTVPGDLFAKKSTFHFMKLLIAVESKLENNASTPPSVKK